MATAKDDKKKPAPAKKTMNELFAPSRKPAAGKTGTTNNVRKAR